MVGVTCPADAQNLLVNPDFDDSLQLTGWSCGSPWGAVTWSSEDLLNDPTSGSVEHYVAGNVNNATATCTQCVPVVDLLTYTMSGWAYWPDDPDVDQIGTTRFGFVFYEEPDCTLQLDSDEVVIGQPPALDMWFELVSDPLAAPAGATSALIIVTTWQDLAGTAVRARIDHLDYSTNGIFADGFESGALSRWSAVQRAAGL
jgi:hypothetical protein